jgi:hypothetical protein
MYILCHYVCIYIYRRVYMDTVSWYGQNYIVQPPVTSWSNHFLKSGYDTVDAENYESEGFGDAKKRKTQWGLKHWKRASWNCGIWKSPCVDGSASRKLAGPTYWPTVDWRNWTGVGHTLIFTMRGTVSGEKSSVSDPACAPKVGFPPLPLASGHVFLLNC